MSDEFDQEVQGEGVPGFEAQSAKAPKKLSEVRDELGLDLLVQKAEDLVDTSFVILAAKPWESPLAKGATVYWCTCSDPNTGELFNVNLGGQAVVEILRKAFASGLTAPLEVTLRKHSGGKFGRYYTLE